MQRNESALLHVPFCGLDSKDGEGGLETIVMLMGALLITILLLASFNTPLVILAFQL
jgi:hypothetical protein